MSLSPRSIYPKFLALLIMASLTSSCSSVKNNETTKPTSPAVSDGELPVRPSRQMIYKAMRGVQVKMCEEKFDAPSDTKIRVKVMFLTSGRVGLVRALPPIDGTPFGTCIEDEVRRVSVSPSKKTVEFTYPFKTSTKKQ